MLKKEGKFLSALAGFFNFTKKEKLVHISDYLEESLVVFLDVLTQEEALKTLVQKLWQVGKLKNKDKFYKAILDREKIVSTGIGLSVAIPHAKLQGYEEFFIAIGIQSNRGIEWNSLDGTQVHLIFMIGGPDNKQTEYLNILSKLTEAVRSPEKRQALLNAKHQIEVIHLLT